MKRWVCLIIFFLIKQECIGQIPTFSQDVAPIIFNHCTGCHRPGNIGPFSLTNYDEVSGAAYSILSAVNNKIMPPWPPDPEYRHFLNERALTQTEIQTINDWVSFGMSEGDTSLLPPFPTFAEGSEIGIPDLQFNLPHYTLTSSQDEYRCFVIHSGITQEVFVKSFEFLPGNKLIDHHAVIFWDTSGVCQLLDNQTTEPGYSSASSFAGTDNAQKIAIWVPGSPPLILPPNFGYRIPGNSDIIIQIHYPAGSAGLMDSSKLNIFYQQGSNIRNVTLRATINIVNITDGPFIIPADSIKTHQAQTSFLINTSLIGVMPHMHLLGKSTFTYAIQPNGDTVKLVSIPNWNFHWQGTYLYNQLIKVNQNATLNSEFTYDNTIANLSNPNNPPQTVLSGNSSEDEMMVTAFLSVPYKAGDENIFLGADEDLSIHQKNETTVYPNPCYGNFVLNFNLEKPQKISAALFNVEGVLVKKLFENIFFEKGNQFQICDATDIASGIYFIKTEGTEMNETKKIIIFK